jgi:peroxiredoxin family protein
VSIIISKGTLEGVYPGLIMANGARMEGIEANLFFTFFGMDAVLKRKQDKVKVATVGNPALGLPTLLGALPGMSSVVTKQMQKKMEHLDIPPIGEFVQMIADSGGRLGDRVGIGYQQEACFNCSFCKRGTEQLCASQKVIAVDRYGGLAEHIVVDARFGWEAHSRTARTRSA